MPLIIESHDSLPYIDDILSKVDRDKANALIFRELKNDNTQPLHSSLPPLPKLKVSEMMTKELDHVASGKQRAAGIDLSRYEAPDEPSSDSDAKTWRQTLRTAYISNAYLSGRHTNLTLLEELGKNAWLMSNSQLDQILKTLDKEMDDLKEATDSVNKIRKTTQESSKGELLGLEDAWKRGIARLLEVQLATANLRQELLQRR